MDKSIRVYVATPYGALRCSDNMRDYLAQNIAKEECAKIKRAGYEPVSAVLELAGKFSEDTQRDEALEAGIELLESCDHIYMSTHPDSKNSKGMSAELDRARELGISELVLNKDGSAELVLGI
ncbi:DUF4406 domain-containing protein [Campylobacter sp. RM16191]|uniref:DUF7768 domain-containing protein n=1 Tax=Campylobacter sp. RM16191 TaxID=1705728 RepID=UPI0014731CE4|nr:DUF4406 domain-containing protein [Campylobacter sp. RM16191]